MQKHEQLENDNVKSNDMIVALQRKMEFVIMLNVEHKVIALSHFYQNIPLKDKLILCFDCLYDPWAEAIDAFTLFEYYQSIGRNSKYVLLETNPLYAKLQKANQLKDVLPVKNEAELLILYPEIVAQAGYVFSSFGYYYSKIFKKLPSCVYVYIDHGVMLLKKSVLSLYVDGGPCENDLMLCPTRATKKFWHCVKKVA